MKVLRTIALVLVALVVVGAVILTVAGRGLFGDDDSRLVVPTAAPRDAALVAQRELAQRSAAAAVRAGSTRQILFGDLHVHTTISFDAFMLNLPLMGGEGAHPPADACDFARHCAGLDFWSINDHSPQTSCPPTGRTPWRRSASATPWRATRANPDLVSFLGWEWTQAGRTPAEHYGHKNVVLAHTDDARIPSRPIAASAGGVAANPPNVLARGALAIQGGRFHDMARRWTAISEMPICADGPVRSLGTDCREVAATPDALFAKLDDWGHDALVIPHGTTWGIYSPPGTDFAKQLEGEMHDPERQVLLEVYSGHGDAEVYREWRAVEEDIDGSLVCPPGRDDYLPMCEQAGRIVEARCAEEGADAAACRARGDETRAFAANAGVSMQVTVPGAAAGEWLDAGQCRDCAQPAFNYRPRGSAQYIAALGSFSDAGEEKPRRFRMGFLASSDIHNARAGAGYKELRWQTDAGQSARDMDQGIVGRFIAAAPEPKQARGRSYEEAAAELSGIQLFESERTTSFLYTGGLVAVHAEGRSREAIWSALERREVYGTSGPRILLWFDLLHEAGSHPMGSELSLSDAPIFRVRAVGSFEPAPGCPASAREALGPERLASLCRNECDHPSDRRRRIERIEVVRIRPQQYAGEPVGELIDDPWMRFDCPDDPAGCTATFVDDEFASARRETVYYARVFEEPTPTVNGDPLDCERDERGRCLRSTPCERGRECLADHAQRAWSSPIYVDWVD